MESRSDSCANADAAEVAASGASEDILDWSDERSPDDPIAPPPLYAMVQRSGCPVRRVRIWDGSVHWLVTGYRDYREVLSNVSVSSNKYRPGYPLQTPSHLAEDSSFLKLDDPEHLPYRRLWVKHLSARKAEALRPTLHTVVDGYVHRLLDSQRPSDFVEVFSLPVSAATFGVLFGAAIGAELDEFCDATSPLAAFAVSDVAAAEAYARFRDCIERLVARAESAADGEDGIVADLVRNGVGYGIMTRAEVVDTVCAIVVSGQDALAAMVTLGTLAVLRDEAQLAVMRENRADGTFMANATEELLRFVAPNPLGRRRVAVRDLDVGGQLVHAGEGIIALENQSSRDSEVFDRPDVLDLRRPNAKRHTAFGYGTHQCAGQSVTRVALEIVYTALFTRIPTLRLAAPQDQLRFRQVGGTYGVERMPVTW